MLRGPKGIVNVDVDAVSVSHIKLTFSVCGLSFFAQISIIRY